jgi:hypothetical protein
MGEVLGIGCTHAPHLQFVDQDMPNVLRRTLRSPATPAELQDPRNWPAAMRAEWADDEGLASAAAHRAKVVAGFRAARAALDAFHPDFVLIWGDDQYENFHVDVLPPFCVYALKEMAIAPFQASDGLKAAANVWGEPTDQIVGVQGHEPAASHLAGELIGAGFDVACAYAMHHRQVLGHAFTRTVLYLDYDREGFPYPVIPFHVNCYGRELRVRGEDRDALGSTPPPSPPPWRCYDLGKAVRRILEASPWRAAIIGSSSWSHATLTPKHHYLYPDMEADRQRFQELASGDLRCWRDLDPEQIRDSGQHEILNWVCLAGAMEGRQCEVLAHAETYIFNSTKSVVVFPAEAGQAMSKAEPAAV